MTSPKIKLFDLTYTSLPWCPNSVKTSQLLHAKGVDFETEYLGYTELPERMKAEGLTPNESTPHYTVPIIRLEQDGQFEFIMDSEKIARRIEELFPDPRLTVNQDSTLYKAVDADINELFSALLGLVWYKVAFQHIPDQAGKDYYITSREEKTGKKFADFPAQFEPGWEKAAPALERIGNRLLEKPGPYLEGMKATYADVRVLSPLAFLFSTDSALLERALSLDEHGGLAKLWKATTAWRPELAKAKAD